MISLLKTRYVLTSSQRMLSKEILTPPSYQKPEKEVNHLKKFLVDKIRASGPITVAEYMKTSVSAPSVGYYGRFSEQQKVFGSSGDFITSPELTQLFGEMIGVWVFYELANTGHKGAWQLVELGPGRAQLMNDVLNALNKFQDRDVSVHLVEMSDALIEEQERVLCVDNSTPPTGDVPYVKKNKSRTGVNVYWYKSIDDIPDGFTVFIGNEFLDALPVHQFQRSEKENEWNEVYINLDKNMDLCFMKSKSENLHTRGLIPPSIREDSTRQFWECSPEAGTVVNQITDRITTFGGFSLLVDYGHDGSKNTNSFRAYKDHKLVDPLSRPGMVDLTADVNFGYLSSLISDRTLVYGPNNQRDFLAQLGIEHRLRRLLKTCSERTKQEHLISFTSIFDSHSFLATMLVLLIGDFHLPHRAASLSPKFRKLLVPNKMQHVLCTGNLCTRETYDYLRTLSSDVHVVRGDFDDESQKYPDTKVVTVGQFRIGLCHGHQIIPWGDSRMMELLARQLDVDVLVTGNTYECVAAEKNGRFFVEPGSATGAFSINKDGPVTPSFALLDVQTDSIVTYLYRLLDDNVKVDRVVYKKTKHS